MDANSEALPFPGISYHLNTCDGEQKMLWKQICKHVAKHTKRKENFCTATLIEHLQADGKDIAVDDDKLDSLTTKWVHSALQSFDDFYSCLCVVTF